MQCPLFSIADAQLDGFSERQQAANGQKQSLIATTINTTGKAHQSASFVFELLVIHDILRPNIIRSSGTVATRLRDACLRRVPLLFHIP